MRILPRLAKVTQPHPSPPRYSHEFRYQRRRKTKRRTKGPATTPVAEFVRILAWFKLRLLGVTLIRQRGHGPVRCPNFCWSPALRRNRDRLKPGLQRTVPTRRRHLDLNQARILPRLAKVTQPHPSPPRYSHAIPLPRTKERRRGQPLFPVAEIRENSPTPRQGDPAPPEPTAVFSRIPLPRTKEDEGASHYSRSRIREILPRLAKVTQPHPSPPRYSHEFRYQRRRKTKRRRGQPLFP